MIYLYYDVKAFGKWRHITKGFDNLLDLANSVNVLFDSLKLKLTEDVIIVKIYETDK